MNHRMMQFIALCAIVSLGAQTNVATLLTSSNRIGIQSQWIAFAPPDEEITAMLPGRPTIRNYPSHNNPNASRNNSNDTKYEPVLAHREYGGYGDGLVFVIHSFKAEHPEKLSSRLLNLITETDVPHQMKIGDLTADVFHTIVPNRYAGYMKRTLRFMTAHHLYVIMLMVIDDNSPVSDQFISGIKLRRNSDQTIPIEPSNELNSTYVWNAKDVTRKAIVVWKSEPLYTEEARAHQIRGDVSLQVVLGENGYVTDITVVKGLIDGLTEAAIEAARNIRFFPAEKDGQRVAQRAMLEYHFDLY